MTIDEFGIVAGCACRDESGLKSRAPMGYLNGEYKTTAIANKIANNAGRTKSAMPTMISGGYRASIDQPCSINPPMRQTMAPNMAMPPKKVMYAARAPCFSQNVGV